jgi:hypothetical protein
MILMVTVGSSRSSAAHGKSSAVKVSPESSERPKVLLAAKTYANDPLKPTPSVGFCMAEGPKTRFGKNLSWMYEVEYAFYDKFG